MSGRALLGALLVIATAAVPAGVRAQSSAELDELRREVEQLKAGQDRILKELEQLRSTLGSRPAAGARAPATGARTPAATVREVILAVDGAPAMGDAAAPVTIVEFSDYQCPFCARHVKSVLPLIDRDYVKTGKVRYVLRDFPLEQIHPQALRAHEAARCAAEQGRYWEMHARLFADPRALAQADLAAHARAAGADPAALETCLTAGRHAEAIRQEVEEAKKVGVKGTPTFFFGVPEPGTTHVRVQRALTGAQPYERFRETIELLLNR